MARGLLKPPEPDLSKSRAAGPIDSKSPILPNLF